MVRDSWADRPSRVRVQGQLGGGSVQIMDHQITLMVRFEFHPSNNQSVNVALIFTCLSCQGVRFQMDAPWMSWRSTELTSSSNEAFFVTASCAMNPCVHCTDMYAILSKVQKYPVLSFTRRTDNVSCVCVCNRANTERWAVQGISCIITASFSKAGWILIEYCRVFHRLRSHSSKIRENFQAWCPSASHTHSLSFYPFSFTSLSISATISLLIFQSFHSFWAFVSLLIPFCVSHFLQPSLVTSSPCEICIRATRGAMMAKPLSVPWHRKQLVTLSAETYYWGTKCCDELLKSCTMADKMFG